MSLRINRVCQRLYPFDFNVSSPRVCPFDFFLDDFNEIFILVLLSLRFQFIVLDNLGLGENAHCYTGSEIDKLIFFTIFAHNVTFADFKFHHPFSLTKVHLKSLV